MQHLGPGGKKVCKLEPDLETPAISRVRGFLQKRGARAWLTGGTVRDLLLGRSPCDIDLVTEGSPVPLARDFADETAGSFFVLSEEFMTCRVVHAETPGTYDFAACRDGSIESDLSLRDFTVDAMAVELPAGGGVIDPLGGRDDLSRGRLAAVSDEIFDHDPLRLLRAPRLEKETGLALSGGLARLIREKARLARQPAVERTFAELVRLLGAPGGAAAVRRLDELRLLEVLLPELSALKGVEQNEYHHLDVYDHTLANNEVLDSIIEDPTAFFPEQAQKLKERPRRRVAGDAGWLFVMSFASLMHDIAKPYCKFTDTDGQVRFFEHDRLGAEMTSGILGRFKAGAETTRAVSFLVRKHMRFEGLIQQEVPSDRARMRYLRATAPFSPEAIMLSVSDRLSVRGPRVTEHDVERHLALAREMMNAAFAQEEAKPLPPLIRGDDLMRELDIKPGPLVGALLDRIREEQLLGHIASREEALKVAALSLQERKSSGPGG